MCNRNMFETKGAGMCTSEVSVQVKSTVGADVGMAALAPGLDLDMCVWAESEQNGADLQCEGWCQLNTSSDKTRGVRSAWGKRVTTRSLLNATLGC